MAKRIKRNEPWWKKTGFLQGMGAALIAGVVAIGISISKSDSPTAVEQTCDGDNCIQIGESSGPLNINTKQMESEGKTK